MHNLCVHRWDTSLPFVIHPFHGILHYVVQSPHKYYTIHGAKARCNSNICYFIIYWPNSTKSIKQTYSGNVNSSRRWYDDVATSPELCRISCFHHYFSNTNLHSGTGILLSVFSIVFRKYTFISFLNFDTTRFKFSDFFHSIFLFDFLFLFFFFSFFSLAHASLSHIQTQNTFTITTLRLEKVGWGLKKICWGLINITVPRVRIQNFT